MRVEEIARDSKHYPAMLALRVEVLRKPLGLEYSDTDLNAEADQRHFLLINSASNNSIVGCALLTDKSDAVAKIRQVAIADSQRGRGLGRILMEGIEKAATESGFSEVELHARETAVSFYKKIGYEIVGDEFIEIGLPHFTMRKPIGNS